VSAETSIRQLRDDLTTMDDALCDLAAELATAKAENGTLRDQLNAANEKAAWAEVQADGVRDTLRIYGDQTRQLQSDNARLRAELNRFEMERDSLLMELHKATDGRDGWDQS
jgi:chromosome segregation ATPase